MGMLIGSNFKTRAIVHFINDRIELRLIAGITKDYREFVEVLSIAKNYEFHDGVFFDSDRKQKIKWNDNEINIDQINEFLNAIRFCFIGKETKEDRFVA